MKSNRRESESNKWTMQKNICKKIWFIFCSGVECFVQVHILPKEIPEFWCRENISFILRWKQQKKWYLFSMIEFKRMSRNVFQTCLLFVINVTGWYIQNVPYFLFFSKKSKRANKKHHLEFDKMNFNFFTRFIKNKRLSEMIQINFERFFVWNGTELDMEYFERPI